MECRFVRLPPFSFLHFFSFEKEKDVLLIACLLFLLRRSEVRGVHNEDKGESTSYGDDGIASPWSLADNDEGIVPCKQQIHRIRKVWNSIFCSLSSLAFINWLSSAIYFSHPPNLCRVEKAGREFKFSRARDKWSSNMFSCSCFCFCFCFCFSIFVLPSNGTRLICLCLSLSCWISQTTNVHRSCWNFSIKARLAMHFVSWFLFFPVISAVAGVLNLSPNFHPSLFLIVRFESSRQPSAHASVPTHR